MPKPPSPAADGRRVALVTLGCARNEVDSEELAARLSAAGWQVGTDGTAADVVLVNTCGFVAEAKQESIDTLLGAANGGAKVVAAGCLAERYGRQLADSLPEADAVLGFDQYPHIAARLEAVLAGREVPTHAPTDRRSMLPIAPLDRRNASTVVPGHGSGTGGAGDTGIERGPAHLKVLRQRLDHGPVAALKLASGCDRRCSFCAIPSFRGAFVSRTPDDLLSEAHWLAGTGVRELYLVSENSTSYGKDLGDPRLLEKLLPQLAAVPGIVRVRVSYLQPAEMRQGLVEAIATTPGVAAYFDLSFQHSSEPVLRRMRRFGSTARFLELLASVRAAAPDAGVRSNVIVGFPGETQADLAELERFLEAARLDAVGVFGYSDEDGTEAATLPGKVRAATVRRRVERVAELVDQLCSQRADERTGGTVDVMIDLTHPRLEGRADHQAPEVDGSTNLIGGPVTGLRPGDLVRARVIGSEGVDLVAEPVELLSAQRSGAASSGLGSAATREGDASRRRGASKSARH
jgi:ribosomal protein S12 methylthiotransferase RimO